MRRIARISADGEPVGSETALLDIEIRLLEQEHRWFHLCRNLLHYWDAGPAYRSAVVSAFFWKFLFRGAAASGVGLAALLGLYFSWQNNLLLARQTEVSSRQAEQQLEQGYSAVKMRLLEILYDRQESCDDEARQCPPSLPICKQEDRVCPLRANARIRSDAVRDFVSLEKKRGKENPSLSGIDLAGVQLQRADLAGVLFLNSNLQDTDFSEANLKGAGFSGNLRRTRFLAADLSGGDFYDADLRSVRFTYANLYDVFFFSCELPTDFFKVRCPDGVGVEQTCEGHLDPVTPRRFKTTDWF